MTTTTFKPLAEVQAGDEVIYSSIRDTPNNGGKKRTVNEVFKVNEASDRTIRVYGRGEYFRKGGKPLRGIGCLREPTPRLVAALAKEAQPCD